jgi:hypothetical protein
VGTWDELKVELRRLADDESQPLRGYPNPRGDDDRAPPFQIELAAWAVDAAAELHRRFGRDVDLTVGFLHFPDRQWLDHAGRPRRARRPEDRVPLLDPDQISVSLDEVLEARTGYDFRAGLVVRNLGAEDVVVRTNGQVTAAVIDPSTDEIVGGFAGAQRLPLVVFRIVPGGTETIPLLGGTASTVPRLGYAVPPGAWAIEATLPLAGDGPRRTAPLAITVVS